MPQVPTQIRRERARKLREIGKKIYCKLLKNQILHKHRVLIESDKGIGKTENNFKFLANQITSKTKVLIIGGGSRGDGMDYFYKACDRNSVLID